MASLITRIVLALALIVGMATTASAQIVTNGSFENGLNGWFTSGTGTTPGIGITAISTNGSNDTSYGDDVPNYSGTHAAYFVDDNAFESLSQFVSLVGGTKYNLSYALFATASGAGNPFGFALTDSVGLNILGTVSNTGSSTDVPVGAWTPFSYSFVAPVTSNAYLLNFNFRSGATPAKDVLLDAVNISAAVPEPSTWAMMILGLGAIGFAMRRRRGEDSAARMRVAYN